MHKLLPFRQYDEKDVINLFSLDITAAEKALKYINLVPGGEAYSTGANWSGTAVSVRSTDVGKFGGEQPGRTNDPYLGAIGSGNQGDYALQQGSFYPETQGKIALAADNAAALGITIRPTLAWDENATKLLDYPVKKDELQCVLPGEAVPVATKGFFTLTVGTANTKSVGIWHASGIAAGGIVPGSKLKVSNNGKLTLDNNQVVVATVVATGKNAGKDVALVQIG